MTPALLLFAATFGPIAAPPEPVKDLKLPPGFTASLYADNLIAPDIYTMTIDDEGRVLIAGRGYIRVLVPNAFGYADEAIDLIDGLKDGPMGLLAEGDSLYVVSDGGLKRYRGYNGKDKLKNPELLLALKTTGEHDAHAIRRGPDGWLYVLCGNNAGVRKEIIKGDRSPVKEPIAGALIRLSPDFKTVEVVADGFRNPYSFDFNRDGEPFTYDSDNERCVGLPWYEGCRFYHVVPGGNYGWRSPQISQTWRKPPYFPDVVPPICDTGRGSPTGVVCYRHTHFPAIYRGDFFLADWTFGRIYWVLMKPSESSYVGKLEVFAEATGNSGFAPTALAVHPRTGELFVSIGGRGTRGGVYRISYDKAQDKPKPIEMAKRSLDFDKDAAKQWLADCTSDNDHTRRRALELIARWPDKAPWGKPLNAVVHQNLTHDDPLVRRLAAKIGVNWFVELDRERGGHLPNLTLAFEELAKDPRWVLQVAIKTLEDKEATATELLAALRLIHLLYGDLTAKDAVGTAWEGYTLRDPIPRAAHLRLYKSLAGVRSKSREVNLEVARLYAVIGADEFEAENVSLDRITRESAYTDDFHYLLALAKMTDRPRSPGGKQTASALFDLLAKARKQNALVDRHWPIRLNEMIGRLATNMNNFSAEVVTHKAFGRPEHADFARKLSPPDFVAERFMTVAAKEKNYAWTPTGVEILGGLPPEKSLKLLRELWERPELTDAVVRELARHPAEADRQKFVVALKSLDPDIVRVGATALTTLPAVNSTDVYVFAIRALRRFPDDKADAGARLALVTLLQKYSGEKHAADVKSWAEWAIKNDPATEKPLNASDGYDATAWGKRLAGIEWAKGDAERGRAAFAKATCAACHDRGGSVGPSLLGISKRFGRDDLLTAILQPSKDVSPRYRPTRVVTTSDKTYTGIIIYEAVDGVILQTGADTTVRIAGADIASKKQSEVSLMPVGLIDKLTDAEIADLLAYLSTLGNPKPK